MRVKEILREAEHPKVGRALQHAEDKIIVDGSQGALDALDELESMATNVGDVTVKWDGSPAIYFGRNEQGQFVLTDGSGFAAKGYDGKVTSASALQNMFLSRGKEAPDDARKAFAGKMGGLWDRFESIVDPAFRGYLKGDLLYYDTPPLDKQGNYTFTPNTVTYHIPKESTFGLKIANSTTGVVIHSHTTLDGVTQNIKGSVKGIKADGPVMIQGPMGINHLPTIDLDKITAVRNYVTKHAVEVDTLLDDAKLAAEKVSDFKNILYTFVNQQVDTGDLTNLNSKFDNWLANSKTTGVKQVKIQEYRQHHAAAFVAIFNIIEQVMNVKDSIIDQLDQNTNVGASINGKRGGEGYVKGAMKLVPRLHFSQANRAKVR